MTLEAELEVCSQKPRNADSYQKRQTICPWSLWGAELQASRNVAEFISVLNASVLICYVTP